MSEPLVSLRGLCVSLPDRSRKRLFRHAPLIEIVRKVDLDILRGSALGLVGESGSGKTTLGRTMVRLIAPTAGALRYGGRDIAASDERALRPLRAKLQMVFHNPQSSLNPRLTVAYTLMRPLEAFGRGSGRRERRRRAGELLDVVGLPKAFLDRYPHELSG